MCDREVSIYMHFICVRTTLVAAVNGHVYDLVSVSLVCLLQPLRLSSLFRVQFYLRKRDFRDLSSITVIFL